MNIKLVSVFLFALFIGSFGGHDDKTDEDKDGSQATICQLCEVNITRGQTIPLRIGQVFEDPYDACKTYHCGTDISNPATVIKECETIASCEDGKPPYILPGECCPGCHNLQFNERKVVNEDGDGDPLTTPNVLDTWSDWSLWTDCSRSCGGGRKARGRRCLVDNKAELNCSGKVSEVEDCNTEIPCPVNGGWSDWSEWSSCSVTCDNGTQLRQRTCSNPPALFGGLDCTGRSTEVKQCSTGHCPIDCEWLQWGSWGDCSVTCGGGRQVRKRFFKPAAFEGKNCVGRSFEVQRCSIDNCPINGGWSDWSKWTECPVSCGGSNISRQRDCNNPPPQYGGHNCQGLNKEIEKCGTDPCPVDCEWGKWSDWSICNATCDGGTQVRSRNWTDAMYGGEACHGEPLEHHKCNTHECPNPCRPNPCYDTVKCDVLSDTEYKCGDCPNGMRGNGSHCVSINECQEADPCSPLAICEEKILGYTCSACPAGYNGDSINGNNLEDAIANKQMCQDVDECQKGIHQCDSKRTCVNTEGGYQCTKCPEGFINKGKYECTLSNPCAIASENDCEKQAYCNNTAIGEYSCKCPVSMIGNGKQCANDSDSDSVPDTTLTNGCDIGQFKCDADNCKNIPNSGQENSDGDRFGDVCDPDIDNDGYVNDEDNCIMSANGDQGDSDGDGIGDACDNCPNKPNSLQKNLDNDEYGDECDTDKDGDGINNENDICELLNTQDISDNDRDKVGDACDNCPKTFNPQQDDDDQDGLGNACDNDWDNKDGLQKNNDNCRKINNADQLDTDGDGKGDICDPDDDNDGIRDGTDPCPLLSGETDCSSDYDGDGVANEYDVCPYNNLISTTSFHNYFVVKLDPEENTQMDPEWLFSDGGAEITQLRNSDPGMLIGNNRFSSYRYSGTIFVRQNDDDDYIGIVLNYQSNRKFVVAMWKKTQEKYYNNDKVVAQSGLQIKVVNSRKGPSSALRDALWHTGDTVKGNINVKTIYHHKKYNNEEVGWKDNKAYRWEVIYIANSDCLRLTVYDGSTMLINTEAICKKTGLIGGKLGVFVFSQEAVIWSDLKTECLTQPGELSILD